MAFVLPQWGSYGGYPEGVSIESNTKRNPASNHTAVLGLLFGGFCCGFCPESVLINPLVLFSPYTKEKERKNFGDKTEGSVFLAHSPGAGGSGPMHVPQCGITGVVWIKNGLPAF